MKDGMIHIPARKKTAHRPRVHCEAVKRGIQCPGGDL